MFKDWNLSKIDSSLRKCYIKNFQSKTEDLRQFLLAGSTHQPGLLEQYDLTQIVLKVRKKNQKIGLAILSWYFPEEIRFLVQFSLRETWDSESLELKEILLSSKDFAITWLICESGWTESDFFGNIVDKKLSHLWSLTSFYKKSRRKVKKYTGWCRGHQESNRGVSSTLPGYLFAASSVEEENQRKLLFQNNLLLLKRKVGDDLLVLREIEFVQENLEVFFQEN